MERNRWLDGVKFILIVLVIFGHCKHFTTCDSTLQSTKVISRIIHSIYLFHMPLFIMISGYLSKKSDNYKFYKSTKRLLKVFIVFHFLWIGIKILSGTHYTMLNIITPSFTLWYLLSLVYWRCILQYIPSKFDNFYIVLPLTIIISLLGGLIPLTKEFSIPRTLTFMPFFFLGYYTKKNNWLINILQTNILWFLIPAITLMYLENHILG